VASSLQVSLHGLLSLLELNNLSNQTANIHFRQASRSDEEKKAAQEHANPSIQQDMSLEQVQGG